MNLEAVTAELLAQPVAQFTPRRNARVKELKASGQLDLARELSAVKKPSLPLWAANQVRDGALLERLRRSAQAVVKAQAAAATGRAAAAADLRAASDEFQRQLDAASRAAANALRRGEHAAGEEALRRVREIFRLAALEGGATWDRLQRGALATEPRPGDDMLEMFAAGVAPAGGRRAEQADARRAAELAQRAVRANEELAERATATARRLRQEAKEAVERAAASEAEAARARAQAKKSERAARRVRPPSN